MLPGTTSRNSGMFDHRHWICSPSKKADVSVCRKIKVQDLSTGENTDDSANVLITARGQLNEIRWPEIPGLESFQGKIMHSGAWDPG